MPHIDEGTLHALLDGALGAGDRDRAERVRSHLDSCADCRALLDAAEADRHRAGEILGALDAELDGIAEPDFEEVLVRGGAVGGAAASGAVTALGGDDSAAGRDSAQPRLLRQAHWTRGVAWAASLVLALGTGYLIRDRIMPERSASMEMSAPRQPALEDSAPGDAGEAVSQGDAAAAGLESADGAADDRDAASTMPPPPPAPAPAPRQSAERVAPTDLATGAGGAAGAGDAAEKSAEAVSRERLEEAVEESSRRSALRALADQPLGVSAATAPSAPPTQATPTVRAEDAALMPQAAAAPAPDSYATALAFVRGVHYTVPDRPVDRVEVYDVGGALGARTIQTLGDGTTVVLLQRVMEGESPVLDLDALQAAVAADLPEAVRAELRSVMVRRGDQIVVVTAPLAETELRRVAEGLEWRSGG